MAATLLGDRGFLPALDIQKVFAVLPPDSPTGEALFRLVEAFPRTPDRAGRLALIREYLPFLDGPLRAAAALPFVSAATAIVGRQFVYAEDIGGACRHGMRAVSRSPRAAFSFDMLGEGARTSRDAEAGFRRYAAAAAAASGSGASRRLGISVKLSSLHPRFDAIGYGPARTQIADRLRELCRAARAGGIQLAIDAEESERLELQLDLFREMALDPGLADWDGLGLAVQAYRTDAEDVVEEVARIAVQRGTRVTVRLVKGAYWDSEVKRAQELGLEGYPVHTDKAGTDLSYVRCADRLLAHADLIFPQFATHNPVTAACAIALAEAHGVAPGRYEMQRLHGMGAGLERALARRFPRLPVRIYAPVGSRRELLAYLVRRLLENGASTSFVRQAARAAEPAALLAPGFAFLDAAPTRAALPLPREIVMPERLASRGFDLGRPDALAAMAAEVARSRRDWRAGPIIGGRKSQGGGVAVRSPARPEVVVGEVTEASAEQAREAIAQAWSARGAWSRTPVDERAAALDRLAGLLERDAPQLMALCVWEAGKTLADALADVREAVDFCRYYAAQARRELREKPLPAPAGESNVLTLHGRGVFACISPWNFPVAIYAGQVAAALVAGNTVVAKPAEQAALTGFRVAELILEAGVPPEAFHFLPGPGQEVGRAIVEDPRVAGVAFTGSTDTARAIQRALAMRDAPIAPLIAETGGLNAMIVDSTALPEQVVDSVVASAFRSAGQRCSSLRMLYVQEEIAPAVLEMLAGAMATLRLGDPAEAATDIGPLIDRAARDALARYVESMRGRFPVLAEAGPLPREGSFLAPIAFEVGSISDLPGERFGPILHVSRFPAGGLERVIDDINATGFGLTLGVHTRIPSRAQALRERAAVGNVYVNRNMIGAVVGMQPFGGEGLSGTGPKAGGPGYLARFTTERVYTVNTSAAGGDLQLVLGAGL